MNTFLKKHMDWVLVGSALALFLLIVAALSWSVGFLATKLGNALEEAPVETEEVGFRLEEARALDFKGFSTSQ